jgi:hypothetical protein
MANKTLLNDLEQIINDGLDRVNIPYQKGNSIRIGNTVIRKNKRAYMVYNTAENTRIGETFSKTAAIALAKTTTEDKNCVDDILRKDRIIEKYYNDSLFFKHTLSTTNDPIRYEVASNRYEIAREHTLQAKYALDRYIFD